MRRRLNAALPCDHGSHAARRRPCLRRGSQRSVRRTLTPSNLPRGRGRHAAPAECGFAVRSWVSCSAAETVSPCDEASGPCDGRLPPPTSPVDGGGMRRRLNAALPCDHGSHAARRRPCLRRGSPLQRAQAHSAASSSLRRRARQRSAHSTPPENCLDRLPLVHYNRLVAVWGAAVPSPRKRMIERTLSSNGVGQVPPDVSYQSGKSFVGGGQAT